MVGRKRDSKGINYPFEFEESKLKKNLEMTIDFDSDVKKGFNIIVLSHQPGIGKTYNILNYMKEHPNSFYFTDRHSAIDEHTSEWETKEITFSHWKGFDKICNTDEVNDIYTLYHITPQNIYIKYNWREKDKDISEYTDQFNKRERVFAPFNYLNSSMFTVLSPDIVFIDERISQLEEYHFNAEKLTNILKLIDAPSKFIENANKRNYYFFLNSKVREEISFRYTDCVLGALKQKNSKQLRQLQEFNPYELSGYVHWGRIYKYKNDLYAIPFYYYAFDALVNGIPIVISDATININLFHYFLETYNGEMKELGNPGFSKVEVNVKIYWSKCRNPKTKIYRMRPTGAWPRSSIVGSWESKTKQWLSRDMRNIMDIFGQENVGVISYKDYGEICQSFGFDMEYFGSLRGTNLLEDKSVLVIIGAWFPQPHSKTISEENRKEGKEFLDDLVRKYFYQEISKDDIFDVFVGASSETESSHEHLRRGIAHLTTEKKWIKGETPADIAEAHPVAMVNTMFYDEIYQAFHRNRGLRYPRIIFAYCWFPEPEALYHFRNSELDNDSRSEEFISYNLREEFDKNVEKVYNQEIEEVYKRGLKFFEWLSTKYSSGKALKIIREFEKGDMKGVSPSNTKIANKYKIWKGPGESIDNKLIEHFRKIYLEVKEKGKAKK